MVVLPIALQSVRRSAGKSKYQAATACRSRDFYDSAMATRAIDFPFHAI